MGGWTESQTRMGSSLLRKGGYYIAIGRADGTYIKRQAFVKIKRGVVSGLKRGMRGEGNEAVMGCHSGDFLFLFFFRV